MDTHSENSKEPTESSHLLTLSPKPSVIGRKFTNLTVLHKTEEKRGRAKLYLCQCECGKQTTATAYDLRSGGKKSCGCGKWRQADDLRGKVFGLLEVLEMAPERLKYPGGHTKIVWLCRCLGCGTERKFIGTNLRGGGTVSCGCAKRGIVDAKLSNYGPSPVGVSYQTVNKRVKVCGWTVERALNTPLRGTKREPDAEW